MTMPDKTRRTFRDEDTRGADGLNRPLNAFALETQRRLDVLEARAGIYLPEPVTLLTGGTVAQGTAPFPFRVAVPAGVSPRGVLVVGLDNLTTPGRAPTVAPWAAWTPTDGGVLVQLVTGLLTNTRYSLQLAVLYG
jgi:hypothetical protein